MIIQSDESIDLPTPSGPMRTYLLRPVAAGRYPGLVLFSEIFQVTAPVRRLAAMLAGQGFVVAVPEIFHEFEPLGAVLGYDQAGADAGNRYKIEKPIAAYDADARAALDHLAAHPACTGKLGAVGICIGGHLSFRAGMNADVRATACFYATDIHKRSLGRGMNDDSLDRIRDIRGELMMVWGRQDPHIPREGRAVIYNALCDGGAHFTWHEFNAAHAFLRDEGPRYDAALAHLSMGLLRDLLHRATPT